MGNNHSDIEKRLLAPIGDLPEKHGLGQALCNLNYRQAPPSWLEL
jgi:hypothetical protein